MSDYREPAFGDVAISWLSSMLKIIAHLKVGTVI